jgi:hypothetical protein
MNWIQRIKQGYGELSPYYRLILMRTLWSFLGRSLRETGRVTEADNLVSLAHRIYSLIDASCPLILRSELLLLERFGKSILSPIRLKWSLSRFVYLLRKATYVVFSGSWRLALEELRCQIGAR